MARLVLRHGAIRDGLTRLDRTFGADRNRLARVIHDGSLRNRAVALRDGRPEPRGREAYSLQYVDRLSGEAARLAAWKLRPGLSQQRMPGTPCSLKCKGWTAEPFMNNPG